MITIGITLGAAALLVYLALRNPAPQPAQASGRFQLPSQPDDQTCSSWRQIPATFDYRASSEGAAGLIRAGSVGLATDASGQLFILVPSLEPALWRVGLDGTVFPAADSDVVTPDNRPAVRGPWPTAGGGTLLFRSEERRLIHVSRDGQVEVGGEQSLPPGSVASATAASDRRLFVEFEQSSSSFLDVMEFGGGSARYGPIPLPESSSIRRYAVASGGGGVQVRQPLPYFAETHWVPLADGLALWADGLRMQVWRLAKEHADLIYCDPGFVPATISPTELDEAVSRIKWMNQFTDPNWTWNTEPLPAQRAAVERIFSWGDGNIGIVTALEAELRHPDSVLTLAPGHPDSPRITTRDRWQVRLLDQQSGVIRVLTVPSGVAPDHIYTNGSVAWVVQFDSVAGTIEVTRYELTDY